MEHPENGPLVLSAAIRALEDDAWLGHDEKLVAEDIVRIAEVVIASRPGVRDMGADRRDRREKKLDALLNADIPEQGTEDYRRYAVLFNDITYAPTDKQILFSDRLAMQRYLWSQGWRREVRDEDVTERPGGDDA